MSNNPSAAAAVPAEKLMALWRLSLAVMPHELKAACTWSRASSATCIVGRIVGRCVFPRILARASASPAVTTKDHRGDAASNEELVARKAATACSTASPWHLALKISIPASHCRQLPTDTFSACSDNSRLLMASLPNDACRI